MNVWAEERKQGTDELLFTLPSRDIDIVLGKYWAAVGIYSVALFFSLSHLIILAWLGDPDVGLMGATYLGYWLAGAALIPVGMAASLLSANATVAFILGAIFTGLFMIIHTADALLGPGLGKLVHEAGVIPHLQRIADGALPVASVLYFVGLALVMLYVNVVLVDRRHTLGSEQAPVQATHYTLRAVSLAAIAVAVCVVVAHVGFASIDVTAERLHTLQPQSIQIVEDIPDDRPVYIQAFFSDEVPRPYIPLRKNLKNILNRLDQIGGDRVYVTIHDVEPYTEEARQAQQSYNINPVEFETMVGGARSSGKMFFGLVFTSGPEEFVIPFFDAGLPPEYEVARSIRVVTQAERKKIGVVTTDAKVFGDFDIQTMQSQPSWPFVEELRKQYAVEQVPAGGPYPEDLDAVVVVMPSSLSQPEMDALQDVMQSGTPTVLFDDPSPLFNPGLAASERKNAGRNPFMNQGRPPPTPKGNFDNLLASIGLSWTHSDVVWSTFNPHPMLANVPLEFVFVGANSTNPMPFNQDSEITSGLQEVVLLDPASIYRGVPLSGADLTFTPLLQTGPESGLTKLDDLYSRHPLFGMTRRRDVPRYQTSEGYTLAMEVKGTLAPEETGGTPTAINVVFVADADLISTQFFELRRRGGLALDNVTFALNCIDTVAGDESFVALRKHRPRHRTLALLEQRTKDYLDQRQAADEAAEAAAQTKLNEAQARLQDKVKELQGRTDLDERTKRVMLDNLERVENRRLEVVKNGIEAQKDKELNIARTEMEMAIARIEREIKWWATLLPPIPTLVLAIVLLAHRRKRERVGIPKGRLVGG